MKTKIKTFLPIFSGFYGTLFESIIDDAEVSAIDDHNEENETELFYSNFNFDYKNIQNAICKKAVSAIEDVLNQNGVKCKIVFEAISSPKEYNFANDSINCEIEFENYGAFIAELFIAKESFESHIKDKYTSCSGFISSHSNLAYEWIEDLVNDPEDCEHKVGSTLDFLLENVYGYGQEELYYSVSDGEYYEIDYTVVEND